MVNESPAAVLFNRDGYDVVITDGYTIIPEQSGIIMAGRNGSTAKFITLDGYGQTVVVGAGIAGSPSGGVITIQGIVGGQAIPVSGNFTNASVSLVSTSPPGSATYIGGSVTTLPPTYTTGQMDALSLTTTGLLRVDGSNVTQPVSGTVTVVQPTASNLHALVVGAAPAGSIPVGNPVLVAGSDGTNVQYIRLATDGTVRIDPTGTTTQPVSQVGTWSVSQVTSPWITRDTIADGYLQSILANQTNGTQHTIVDGYVQTNPNVNATQSGTWTVQQGTPPWITKDGYVTTAPPTYVNNTNNYLSLTTTGLLRVDGSNVTQPVSQVGTWTVQQGTPPWTITGIASDNTTNSTAKLSVLPAIAKTSPPSWTDGYQIPLTTLLTGALRTDNTSWLGSTAPTVGTKTASNSIPVTMASDQPPIQITGSVVVTSVPGGAFTGLITGFKALGGGSANTLDEVMATTYNEQTTNAQRSISSASANDSAAGTGARKITIIYYKSDGYGPFTEIVTMNGVTPVNTVATDICFIEEMYVYTAGSLGTNAAVITLFVGTAGGGGTLGQLGFGTLVASTGDGNTLWAHHHIPPGKTASLATVILSNFGGTGSGITTMILKSKYIGVANAAWHLVSDLIAVPTGQALVRQLGIPIKIVGPARILGYTIPASNNTNSELSFDFSEI